MATYAQIIDACVTNIQDVLDDANMPTALFGHYIQEGWRDLTRRLKVIAKEFSITTTANQALYGVDATIQKIIAVKYLRDATTEFGIKLVPYPGGYNNLPEDKTFGLPYWYYLFAPYDTTNRKIGTIPIISESNEALVVAAYYKPEDLSEAASPTQIPENWETAIPEYVSWKIFEKYAFMDIDKIDSRGKSRQNRTNYANKALIHKANYLELVRDAKEEFTTEQDDEFTSIVDVYNF